jgi:ADP-ribose pyrophosphatase YjhB (NUDIX family)
VGERIDYLDDPAAPEANSVVPSANVIVVNDQDEILMIRRTDNGNWAVPGGGMDLGESITDTAVRETREETGIICEITGLVGIYTSPRHVILYTSNGEARQEFSIVFTGRPVGGRLRASSESAEPQWVAPSAIVGLQMHPSMRQRIQHYLDSRSEPYLG